MKLADLLIEAKLLKTVANGSAFVDDVFKAFKNTKDATLNITVALRGTNVLEYTIERADAE